MQPIHSSVDAMNTSNVDLDSLVIRARNRRRVIDSAQGEARATLLRGKQLQDDVAELAETVEDLDRVTGLLNSLGEAKQMQAQQTIEELVTRGLQTIFDDTLSFHIIQTMRGKTASVDFVVRTTLGGEVIDTSVMEARGGGLAATIGFLLRLVVMLLSKGTKTENILVLDETFGMVSAEYIHPLGEFLREVVEKTGVQIVLVTHEPEFEAYADQVIRFSTENGYTKATAL